MKRSSAGAGLTRLGWVKLPLVPLAVATCLSLHTGASYAADYTWDTSNGAGIQGGAGTWNNGNQIWTTDGGGTNTNWADGATAVFGGTAPLSSSLVSLNGVQDIGGLTFSSDGYSIAGNGGSPDRLNLAGPGPTNITVSNAADTAIIRVDLTGSGAVNVNGPGILALTGDNSYSGITNITGGGTLRLASSGSIENGVNVQSGSLNNLGTIDGGVTNSGTVTNGAGAVINGGLRNIGGTVNASGTINDGLSNESTITGTGTVNVIGSLTVNGVLSNHDKSILSIIDTVSNPGPSLTSNSPIQNVGTIVINGSSTRPVSHVIADISNGGTVNAAGSMTGDFNNGTNGVLNTTFVTNTTAGAFVISGTLTNGLGGLVDIDLNERLNATNITNQFGATIDNGGTLASANAIINAGTLNTSGIVNADISNSRTANVAGLMNGDLNNSAGGEVNTAGTFVMNGTLNNQSAGQGVGGAGVDIDLNETLSATSINNYQNGTIQNDGTLTAGVGSNPGTITNAGTIRSTFAINGNVNNGGIGLGGVPFAGTLDARGTISGNVNNGGLGVINTTGILFIGTAVRPGTLNNFSTAAVGVDIDSGEQLTAVGAINNYSGATIQNDGTLTATNGILNDGTLNSTFAVNANIINIGNLNAAGSINGDVNNTGDGLFTTTGALTVAGTLTNSSGLPSGVSIGSLHTLTAQGVTNAAGGSIENLGVLTATNGPVRNAGNIVNYGEVNGGLVVDAGDVTNFATGIIDGGTTINGGIVSSQGRVTGNVAIEGGVLRLLGAGRSVLDDAAVLTVNGGILSVANSETVGGLTGTGGRVDIATGQAFTVNQSANQTYGGAFTNSGTFSLLGSGNMTLTGNSSGFAGTTGVNGATLTLADSATMGGNIAVANSGLVNVNGTATGVVTAIATGRVGGDTGTIRQLELNGGEAVQGATLTVAGITRVINGGIMAATLNGAGTGAFDMRAGTFSGGATNFESFVHRDGTLAAGSSISTVTYGETGGTDLGATISAQLRASAIGGTISDLSSARINVTNGSGAVTIGSIASLNLQGVADAPVIQTASSGATLISVGGNITGARVGALGPLIQTQSTGSTNIFVGGSINGERGIDATASGLGSKIDITTNGLISTDSTAISMNTELSGELATANINENVAISGGDAAFVGRGNTAFYVGANSSVTASNVFASLSGGSILNNSGAITGGIFSGAGNLIVNNQNIFNIATTSYFGGSNDQFSNSGTLNASGFTNLGGLELFTNSANGVVDIQDADVADTLQIGGDMANSAGSVIQMNVDLRSAATDRGDTIRVIGNLTSSGGVIDLNNLDPDNANLPVTELLLIDAGSIDPAAQFAVTGLTNEGIFTYRAAISQLDASNLVLQSVLDAQAAGGIVSNFITAQNSVSNAFFRPASGFVSSPLDPAPNQLGFAPWFRTSGGYTGQGSSGGALVGNQIQAVESEVKVGFGGYQFGLDGGIFNIGGKGGSLHLGVTAGQILGSATQVDFNNKTTMKDTFVGAYAIYSKGPFFVDAQLRQEFIDYTVNVDDRGFVINNGRDQSQRFSAGVSGGYAFDVGKFSLVPAAGYTFARTSTDNLDFDIGTVTFEDTTSHLAFAGITATTSFLLLDDQLRVSPFVSATAYHDFGKDQSAQLALDAAPQDIIDVTSGSGKTYGEVSLGANFLTLTPEIAGTQRLLSGNVRGDVQFGKDRLGGSLNAQLRLQF